MKRFLALLLALVMSLPVVAAAAEQANPFADVPAGAYYHDAVLWALEEGVTTGVTATQFQPTAACTRGQVATFLWRAKGKPEPTIANPFKDVAASSPFYKAILWAAETGITSGVTADTFNPNGTCTGAHVVTFLWRANGKPAAAGKSALAESYPADAYYKDAVAWAETSGLLTGTGAAFEPNALSPRANIVTYLYRDAEDPNAGQSGTVSSDKTPAEKPTEQPAETVLYQHTVTATTFNKDDPHIDPNSTRGWAQTDYFNGDTSKPFQILRIYNNISAEGGLPNGETMTVDFHQIPDIDTAKVNAVHLSFKHVRIDNDGDNNIKQINQLQVLVSTDNGKTWKTKTAGLLSHELLGAVTTKDGREGMYFNVVTGDLAGLVNEGEIITNVRLKPYGDYAAHAAAFRISEVTVTAYDKALAAESENGEYIQMNGEDLRKLAVDHMKSVGAIQWTTDQEINTMNYSDVGGNVTNLPMKYYAGYLHKGPLYTRVVTASKEMVLSSIVDGKYVAPVTADEAVGMDCTHAVFDAISRFAGGNTNHVTTQMLGDTKGMPLVAPLYNHDLVLVETPDIIARFTEEQLYQHYANARPGDIPISRPDNVHVRMVSAEPVVVRNADGSINPAESYILMTEAGGTVYYYWQKSDGTTVRSKESPIEYAKENPDHEFLYGASYRVDEKYTFAQLKKTNYVIMTLEEYQSGKVEKLDLTMQSVVAPEDVAKKGFKAVLDSNYRLISVKATVTQNGKTVYEGETYPGASTFCGIYQDEQLNKALRSLPAGSYTLTLDVAAGPDLSLEGNVPVSRALTMNFISEGQVAENNIDIIKGGFNGADIGFNVSGKYLCLRFERPDGTDWAKSEVQSHTIVVKDSSGKEILNSTTSNAVIGTIGTNLLHQIGKSESGLKNGYTFENVRGLTGVTATVTVVEKDGTVWTGSASGLTVVK